MRLSNGISGLSLKLVSCTGLMWTAVTIPVWALPFNILGHLEFTPTGGSNPVGAEIDVDPVNRFVYLSAGMGGGSTIFRFDVSSPAAIILNSNLNPGWGSGIGVNPTTGRYATTNGYSGQLQVFNSDTTVFSGPHSTIGCGGSVAAGNGTFGVSAQCSDTFRIFTDSGTLVYSQGGAAVASSVVYNSATGNYYFNKSSAPTTVVVNEVSASVSSGPSVQILEANGSANLVYGVPNNSELRVYDGNTHAQLGVATGLSLTGNIAADTVQSLLYVSSGGQILTYDNLLSTQIDSFSLTDGFTPRIMEMETGDNLLYVTAYNSQTNKHRLYVLESARGVAEPAILVLMGLGLMGFGLGRRK